MKRQSYDNFRQRIHRVAKEEKIPLRVMLELTYRCNFKCGHCYIPSAYRAQYKTKELKTREVFSILEELKEAGCFYLGFTGGEPFLRSDIIQILQYAKRQGFEIIIFTNGSLINDEIADELKKINPNKIDITIPAISEGVFGRVTGTIGVREKVFKAVELLYERRINMGFKTCILKENESEIEKIGKFTQSFGGIHRWDDMISPRLDGSKEPYKHRSSAILALRNKLRSEKKISDRRNSKKPASSDEMREIFPCEAGMTEAAITPAGELKICPDIDYFKCRIPEASLKKAWRKLTELRASIESANRYKCNDCELNVYCDWCPAKSWLENRNLTGCNRENIILAKMRRLYHETGKS